MSEYDPSQAMTEPEFVARYADVEVMRLPDGAAITLHQAIAFEADSCPADEDRRSSLEQRLGYLAAWVARAGQLDPDHFYLLPQTDHMQD